MKFLKKYNESADFIDLPANLSNNKNKIELSGDDNDAITILQEYYGAKLYLFDNTVSLSHMDFLKDYIIDYEEELYEVSLEINKENYNDEDYEYYIHKITEERLEDMLFNYEIRGRLWKKYKVIGFWDTISKNRLDLLIDNINEIIDFQITDDWLIHIINNKFVKISDYTDNINTPEIKKEIKKLEKIHLLNNYDKKKYLLDKNYKFKKSQKSEWLKKGVYSKLENNKY